MSIKQTPLKQLIAFDPVEHVVIVNSFTLKVTSRLHAEYMELFVSDGSCIKSAIRYKPSAAEKALCRTFGAVILIQGTFETRLNKERIHIDAILDPPHTPNEIQAFLASFPAKTQNTGPKFCSCPMKDLLTRGCNCGGC